MALRDFPLPEEDIEFLETTGLEWEAITEGNIKRVIIRKLPTPSGYKSKHVDLNVRIEAAYPDTQIDMVYSLGLGANALSVISVNRSVRM